MKLRSIFINYRVTFNFNLVPRFSFVFISTCFFIFYYVHSNDDFIPSFFFLATFIYLRQFKVVLITHTPCTRIHLCTPFKYLAYHSALICHELIFFFLFNTLMNVMYACDRVIVRETFVKQVCRIISV